MASGVCGLAQDQNSAVLYHRAPTGANTDSSKVLKKGRPSGRKPLGDLSNSVKLSIPQASKKLNPDFSSTREGPAFSKVSAGPRKKRIISNATEKKVSIGGRKALSDISNSGKPHLPETSRKVLKATARLGSVTEEPILHYTVSEECFLHNHRECLKLQTKSMDLDEFLKVVGLNSGLLDQSASPCQSRRVVNKLNAKTPSGASDMEEIIEELLIEEEKEDPLSSRKLQTSAHCKTPKISGHMFSWTNYDSINFSLMETPVPKKL